MSFQPIPIGISFQSALTQERSTLQTFTSYYFERDIQTPAASFHFSAPGVDKASRLAIRSGDRAELYLPGPGPLVSRLATGFVDETETHITGTALDYNISGRDTLSALCDNDSVDEHNKMIAAETITFPALAKQLLRNTRISGSVVVDQGMPTGKLTYQTNVGETKINALQRFLEYANCLVWTKPSGQIVIGKPNMAQAPSGNLYCTLRSPELNNFMDVKVKRNTNQAIRRIAVQMQNLEFSNPTTNTLSNQDEDVLSTAGAGVGRSVLHAYSLGTGMDALNILGFVKGGTGANRLVDIGRAYAAREIAASNVNVVSVIGRTDGHLNENGVAYNIDQVYYVVVEDEDLFEPMYVYKCVYELTENDGMTTTLYLCRLGALVADSAQFGSGA
jgi:prophage tail gpP-like protein